MISSVASRVAGLGALTAAGQLVIIGSLPTYSKVFEPGTYGEYLIFVGAFTVVSVLAGVRYDSAIVLPRQDAIAARLSALVMLIALAVSGLIAVATFAATVLGLSPDEHWAPIERHFGYGLATATAIGAVQRCLSAWCVRARRFLLMGWAQFVLSLVTVIAQLSFATIMDQLPALIWGYVCALVFQTLCLAPVGLRATSPSWAPAAAWRGMKIVARKYRRFPTYMVGYALASSARDRLIQLVLGIGAGAAVVGRFGLAYRVVFAPNSLIYAAISPVFFGIASRGTRASVGRFAAGLVETVFVMLVGPYVAFAIEAPALTDAVLSDRWRGTGPYLQALAGPALVLSATCWLDRAFDSFRRQNVAFSLEATFTIISVALVACLSKLAEPVTIAWLFGSAALIYYWIYFLLTFIACEFPMEDFWRATRNGLVLACVVLLGALTIHAVSQPVARVALYATLIATVVGVWFRCLGGATTIRTFTRVADS